MEADQRTLEKVNPPPAQGAGTPRLPIVTMTIIGVTAVTTSLQFFYPALLPALDRNLAALQAGQWWRLITPRFVQPDIWPQYILLAILALVGPPVEHRLGRWRWLLLWLVGDLVGEAVSFVWEPQGAGASIGLCAIIGAWLVLLLWRVSYGPWPVAVVVFWFIGNLIGNAAGGAVVATVLTALVAWLLIALFRRDGQWQRLAPWLGAAGLLGALTLTLLRDQHGPPLMVGACMAAVLLWWATKPAS